MSSTIQISAHISPALKARLERYVRAHGVTRARLIEDALEHHLEALEELPADAIIPARIVLTPESAELVADLLENPPEPSEALKRLFDDR
jgi:uncharacterized protein (DUF1778 family)